MLVMTYQLNIYYCGSNQLKLIEMRYILLSIISFVILPIYALFADSPPIKFGKISEEELVMTVYEADTSAVAVILCDYGFFNAREFKFKRTLRIKILKKEGYEWANRVFPISRNTQSTQIRGATANFENGEIEVTKLKNESIFKERVTENLFRYRISMPAVKVGSVFDIEFSYPSIPDEWYFQQKIPVKYSELTIQKNEFVSFRTNFFGFQNFDIFTDGHWVAKDVPAFKPEPFMSSTENFITKVELDILNISFPGYYYDDVTTNWNEVAAYLSKSDYFGIPLRASGYIRDLAKTLNSDDSKPSEELLKKAYDSMKDFSWNEQNSLYTSKESISYPYKERMGNSADINLALVQLLEKLDFVVKPVVLSTRENGILSEYKPSINKLNYVIARVELDGKTYLLDATEKYAPYDLLPERCLNSFGIQVEEHWGKQIMLNASKKEQDIIYSTLTLNDDLSLEGNIKSNRKDYAALHLRKKYHSFSSEDEFLDDIVENNPGLRISEFTIENLDDPYLPVKETYEVKFKNQLEEIDGELHFYPMVFDRLTRNPLQLEERNYPIDFAYKSSKTYVANITISEKFNIISIPQMAVVQLPEDGVNFTYQVTQMGHVIQFVFKVNINKEIFYESEYKLLQEWYNQILIKHAEPIVLERI